MGERVEWAVSGMDCAACAAKIRTAVERLPGVSDVSVTVMSERLKATLEGTGRAEVEAVVTRLGYGLNARAKPGFVMPGAEAPACDCGHDHGEHDHEGHDHAAHDHAEHDHGAHDHGAHDHDHEGHDHQAHTHSHDDPAERGLAWHATAKGRLVILSGAALAVAWVLHLALPALGNWAFVAACLIALLPIARRAFAAATHGQPFTIESLMTLAALGALAIGAAEEAALVVFLFAVGEVLEGVAANRARDGIRALSRLVPKTALLDGLPPREVPAESLTPGQVVLVRPGDRIPCDGEILEGTSGLDESPVTGESLPVTRGPGDRVVAGAINTEAALRIRVTKGAGDNTIARIIRLVEEAEEARAPTERFIDRFSRLYMPAIVGLSALVILIPPLMGADWQTWIYRGLTLLLIGCPCALVISVPAAIASALASGARHGLLVKGGAVIEALSTVQKVAFDKTGTLTLGRPQVTDLTGDPDTLRLAAAVEAGSSHPIARAILDRAAGLTLPFARNARAFPGRGVMAEVEGRALMVLSPREAGHETAEVAALEAQGKTVVVLMEGARALGTIALRDEPRPDAASGLAALRAMGITPVILTGDNPRTAAAIAGALGAEVRASLMPEDKLREIKAMGAVMMVGDGINDAPALKASTVGVAMGSGTDVALETADAALLRDRVADVAALVALSRRSMGNIRQNVALALGLKAVFLVTSILGVTGLWLAILADTGATVLVTANALRLLRHRM